MKKLIYAFGIVAFLTLGSYAVESTIITTSNTDTSVFDDPPAKKTKKTKCCPDYGINDCKTKTSHKKSCDDSKTKSSEKASTTTTNKSKETTPDKK